jgi:signal transduction histidine kinase
VTIECAFDANGPDILADKIQGGQVLINLITNAAQAMDGKPGRIEIEVDAVDLADPGRMSQMHLQPGKYARVNVRDSGHGMDAVTLGRIRDLIFKPNAEGEYCETVDRVAIDRG